MRVGLFIPCYMDAFEFPWARFLHKIGLHYNCNSLRGINLASPSEIKVAPFPKRYTAPEACGH
jgi:hypothetical protein